MRRRPSALLVPVFVVFALLTAACGDDGRLSVSGASGERPRSASATSPTSPTATPLVGIGNGTYADTLGLNVELKTSIFDAGTEEIEALFAGAIDAGYIGPNPAVNGYVKSNGEALRIVAGATSGGAALVVKPDINGPQT